MFDRLEWDSNFFNLEVGKVNLNSFDQVDNVLEQFSNSAFDLVYAITNPDNLDQKNGFERKHIRIADQKVLFSKQVSVSKVDDDKIESAHKVEPELLALALESGIYSRFKTDNRLKRFYEPLYTSWIEKSVKGQFDDVVFIIRNESKVTVGFVTLKKTHSVGKIGLIAVSEQARGLGTGSLLVQKAEQWCFEQDLKSLEVVTQLDNENAVAFYKRCGFTIKKIENIYHLWK